MQVLQEKRLRQRDLSRETEVVFETIRKIGDMHSEFDIDTHVDYLIEYFHDLNHNSRDITEGALITKALIIAHKV